jgi:hypothetical protein
MHQISLFELFNVLQGFSIPAPVPNTDISINRDSKLVYKVIKIGSSLPKSSFSFPNIVYVRFYNHLAHQNRSISATISFRTLILSLLKLTPNAYGKLLCIERVSIV